MPTNAPIEGVQPGTLDATVSGATEEGPLPPGIEGFVAEIASIDMTTGDFDYLVINTLYARGATSKGVRKDGARAIRELQAIVATARAFTDAANARKRKRHSSPRQVMPPIREDQDPTLNPIQEKTASSRSGSFHRLGRIEP